jgi:carboxyl-terminal processing protease
MRRYVSSCAALLLFIGAVSCRREDPVEKEIAAILAEVYYGDFDSAAFLKAGGGLNARLFRYAPGSARVSRSVSEKLKSRKADPCGAGIRVSPSAFGPIVSLVAPGSAAGAAGLGQDMIIRSVDGKDAGEMSLEDLQFSLRGPCGTRLTLEAGAPYAPPGRKGLIFRLERGPVLPEPSKVFRPAPGIVYARPSEVPAGFAAELKKLPSGGAVSAVILDIRGRGGSDYEMPFRLAGLFLKKKTVAFCARGRLKEYDKCFYAGGGGPLAGVRLAVLADRRTEGAWEVLAHILQRGAGAAVYGEKTPGRVSENIYAALSDGSSLRAPAAAFYSMDGTELTGAGVTPDVPLEEISRSGGSGYSYRDPAVSQVLKALGGKPAK